MNSWDLEAIVEKAMEGVLTQRKRKINHPSLDPQDDDGGAQPSRREPFSSFPLAPDNRKGKEVQKDNGYTKDRRPARAAPDFVSKDREESRLVVCRAPGESTPFVEKIISEALPSNFYYPNNIREYDGSTDPEEHLWKLKNMAILYQYSDAIKCRLFATTLTGYALRWFHSLQAESLTSFEDLRKAFLCQFACYKKYQHTIFDLYNLKQAPTESLRGYMQRFTRIAIEVPTATHKVLIEAMLQGLKNGIFFRSLVKKPPENYDELLKRAEKYINIEEAEKG